MRRKITIITAVLLALIAGLAPVGYAIHAAYTTTIRNAENNLRTIARGIAEGTSSFLLQVDQGLVALSELSFECGPKQIGAMNKMAYDIPGISELLLIRPDRKVVCTSWGVVEPPRKPGLPPPRPGFQLAGPLEIRLMERYGLIALRQREDGSELGALIHPSVLIGQLGADLGEHGFAVLLRRSDSHIYAWEGNVPEMDVVESEADSGDGSTQLRASFRDGIERTLSAVELDDFPGIYSVAAVSDAWILKDWVRMAVLLGAVGLGTSLILVLLVISVFVKRLSLQGELERSLQKDEFEINYLPVISLETGRCVGAEALISWRQPGGKRVRPDLFIPLAEDTGLIEPMTEWLMRKILDETGKLLQQDRSLHIAINLSPSHLETDRILQTSSAIFGNSGVLPEQIIYEITERSLIEDESKAREVMECLNARNSSIALDDFGTGYSSLAYIESFPLDYLKIDRQFVRVIGSDALTVGLIDTIIDMANRLELRTIAEGVETAGQEAYLAQLGVDFAQGWYYSKAVPVAEFTRFLARRNA
ncbi:MAG: EAL domain-containing protein [Gammaproteobacteria bacterium]|nr:EAL domain-containing protein [Gammaproteobacteria bacterium]